MGDKKPADSGGDIRRISTATSPASTRGSYIGTLDPGKDLPSSSAGLPADDDGDDDEE